MVYDFGLRLQALRKRKGLTQEAAAQLLGVTRAAVSAYECNTKTPSLEILVHMARLYNTSLDFMMGMENRPCFYLDGFTENQQTFILSFLEHLKKEFHVR